MRSKKQRLWALALILPFALSVVLGLSLLTPQTARAETATPLLRYDFSESNVKGNTIKNSGSKANSDATIVAGGIGTVLAENGKLKFNQSSAKQTSKDIGYLNLPTDMFNGLSAFTFRMDIDNAYVNTTTNGLFHFTKVDPMDSNYGNGHWTATKKGVESDANIIGGWWEGTKLAFFPNSITGDNAGNYVINNNYLNESFTLSVVWNGAQLKFYLNDSVYATASISAADVQALVVNRVGGFLLGTWNSETEYAEGDNIGWGRNAVTATFDNIELYDSAMSAEDIKALNAKTVTVTDTALLSYDFSSNSVSADGKTIVNKGSKGNSNATIENSSNGIGVYSGKLKFSQSDDKSKDNGYFKLPSDMFSGLSDFTFRMDVDSAKLNMTSLLRFLPGDPRAATLTNGEFIEASWGWVSVSNDYFYLVSSPWDNGYNTRASAYISSFERKSATDGAHYIIKPITISVVWDGNFLAFYVDGITMVKTAVSADKIGALTFNTVGGYLYDWGRNSTYGTFDNIELYDRAFSVKEINAKNAEVKDDTELLLDYDFESANVNENVVTNKGVKAESDATLVGSRGGKIQDGKLIFARTGDYEYGKADAENSYLSLPSDMFKGLDEFTLSIDVDYADVYSYDNEGVRYSTTSLWHFTDVEPTGTVTQNRLEFEWNASKVSDAWKFFIFADDPAAWNQNYATWFNTAAAAGKCVGDGGNVRYDDFNAQQFTLSVVYKDNGYKVYWDDVQVYESGSNTIYPANFANFIVNRFGGMYYGRNAACGEFDNIKMWNKALSTEQLKANATRTETQVITTGANESVVAKVSEGTYTLPGTAVVNDGQQLIGYVYNNALYAPGDTIAVSGRTVRVKAVVMDFAMQSGAWIRMSSLNDSGLRFRTYYSFDYSKLVQRLSDDTDYARVKGLLNDNLSFGTLVTFADAIDRLGDVSKENEKFNIEGKTTYIDIKTNSLTIDTDNELGKKFYNSAIVNLNSYTTEYAARSYVTVTYAGEKTSNYYTAYSRENNARSAKTVALAAKNSADYVNYTDAQKEIIETYIGTEETNAFYVDSVNGNDSALGVKPSKAWKTLGKLSETAIPAGYTVYLNGEFNGTLSFLGSGTENASITITSLSKKKLQN